MPRKRRRRRTVSLPNAPPAENRRNLRGRRKEEDASLPVIFTRLHHLGLPNTPENRDVARLPLAGCAVGQAILNEPEEDRQRLWAATVHLRRVFVAYDRACGAPHRHAQCLRLLAPAEVLHADATTPPVDLRTPEERDRDAVNAWMTVQGWLDHCDRRARSLALRHVVDEPDQPITDWPAVRRALECVADGLEGVRPIPMRLP